MEPEMEASILLQFVSTLKVFEIAFYPCGNAAVMVASAELMRSVSTLSFDPSRSR